MVRWLTRLALSLVIAAFASPAEADQDDPRLDPLFARLEAAGSPLEAQWLEQRIWLIWRAHPQLEVRLLMGRGQAALQRGQTAQAHDFFDRAVHEDPGFAEAWNARATANFLLKDFPRALADANRALLLEPRHFGALAGQGMILTATGAYADARRAFESALDLHPYLPGVRRSVTALRRMLEDNAI